MAELKVNSSPSKEFFLNMITKDVTVESSILDLIDNSIDSYKRNREEIAEGHIDIVYSLKDDYFFIFDNCGGMSKEIAENKAFMFGNHATRYSNALGMYGIGMKRSIFKIGEDFEVRSVTKEDSFKVYMSREEWLNLKNENDEDIWKFYIEDVENDFENGVHIEIRKLSPSLKLYLSWNKNIENLKAKISTAYRELLSKDIVITLNGNRMDFQPQNLFESETLNLKTYVKTVVLNNVSIKIVAGMGMPSPKEAGWTLIANGRAIIENDKSDLTGWDAEIDVEEDNVEEFLSVGAIPAYHNDFARFRGYLYMEAEDANALPLNTTKDGIDKQHPVYSYIFREMCKAMQVILPELRAFQVSVRACNNSMKQTPASCLKAVEVSKITEIDNQKFSLNIKDFTPQDKVKNVPIQIEAKKLEMLKTYFEVKTNKDLGEKLLEFVTERIDFNE